MADLWTDRHEDGLRNRWRAEIARAAGGCRTVEEAALIEGAVLCRQILLGLDALARFDEGEQDEPDEAMGDAIRPLAAELLVSMAHRFRALGLNHDDVRKLDLGRRRRRHANA
jgi:hypothetical protein